ncbi:MAG: hypothetical protein HUJ92_01470 [Bacteroidales bacterium]|nr:hypothetical protein [Bacteroidales bacterium]
MFTKLKNWYNAQTDTTKAMIWIGLITLVLIIIRWDYVIENIGKGFRFYSTKD